MGSIQELLTAGLAHQQAGRLTEAEAHYRQVLARDERQPDAWHLLGTIAQHIRDFPLAVELIQHAVEIDPHNASYLCNLGIAQAATGQLEQAECSYRAALLRTPDFPLAHFNLATLLASTGRIREAADHYGRAIRVNPDFAEAHYNLAVIHHDQHNWNAATVEYHSTLRVTPNRADAWNNLGLVLKEQGHLAQAIECHRRAVQIRPEYAEAWNNLGVASRDARQTGQALDCYSKALQLKPDYAEAFNNLGNTLLCMGRPTDAVTCLKRAIELRPNLAEAYTNLGAALQDLRRVHEAADCLRAALKLNPNDATAMQSLGNAVRDGGDSAEAIACYRKSLELKPDCLSALGQLIHQLQHHCAWDELPELTAQAIAAVEAEPVVNSGSTTDTPLPPFAFLTMHAATSSRQQQRCAARWTAHCTRLAVPVAEWWKDQDSAKQCSDPRIRVGYLSADFRAHPVAELIVELFETHDRSRFAVTGYSYGPDDGSAMRRRMEAAFESFVDLRDLPLAEAIQRIVTDRIDILVDLTGFTQHSRPEILASRPAPVIVNYLGYPGTMGADFVDHILVDDFIVPSDRQPYYNERLVHLPGCYQVNDTRRQISTTTPSRSECGLPDEGFVFCSFNNNYKITPAVFDVWMTLLREVPSSVLWLLESNRQAPINLRREAERRSVDPRRIVFAPRQALPDHLARHRLADLFLDTFPVNAHTTASDALWAGLPVLTLAGETFVSRVAGSLLRTIGLSELITTNLSDYHALALRLAGEPDLLSDVRQRLAANRNTSSLFDIQQSTHARRLRREAA
jgi:predicted O-linked N-acetylglucosamine transferase (SPINDLY family)